MWYSVGCLTILMFEIFCCFKFLNFVVVNSIISKNLKILKISDNKRYKDAKPRQAKIWKMITSLRFIKFLPRNKCTKNEVFQYGIFGKCDQIRKKLRIWPHLLNNSLMENFIFCAVNMEKIFLKWSSFALSTACIFV